MKLSQAMPDYGEEIVMVGVNDTGEKIIMTSQSGMVHTLGVVPGSSFVIDSWYVVRDLEENEGVEWV